jgi:hypothetical protein
MVSSREPVLVEVSPDALLEVAAFFQQFGGENAWITGAQAARIEQLRLGDLYERWWVKVDSSRAEALAGHVVHWPLAGRYEDSLLAPAVFGAQRTIASLGPETGCLLDRFRRSDTPHYLWAILGPAGSRGSVHQDFFGTASWNFLLSGRKLWNFWAARQSPEIATPCVSFEQRPGQIVWIPEDWWHSVTYCEPSFCLSKNLVLLRSLAKIKIRAGDTDARLARHLAALSALPAFLLEPHAAD